MKKNSNDCIHMLDENGSTIYSTLAPECYQCIEDCLSANEINTKCGKIGKHRRGILQSPDGRAFLCSSDQNFLNSSRLFKERLAFYLSMLSDFSAIKNEIATKEIEKTNRLFHNLTSLNAHSIQDLYAIAPQKELGASFKEQKRVLTKKIAENQEQFAKAFLNVLKNEISIRNEFSVYRKLYDPNPAMNFSGHSIHRVILNVANLFFQGLADKDVSVDISETDLRLALDYESIQVALYHLIDNATKYIDSKTTLKIYLRDNPSPEIVMDMTSLYISQEELCHLFDEGVSGTLPKRLGTAGKGLGMGLVRDLLLLNGATITVIPGEKLEQTSTHRKNDVHYAHNQFIISFSEQSRLAKGQSVISRPVAPTVAFRHYRPR